MTALYGAGERPLLCIKRGPVDLDNLQALKAAGWRLLVAADFSEAHRLILTEQPLVGLVFLPGKLDESVHAELDEFLRAHDGLEWIGVFDRQSLETAGIGDLIVNHLFDHHTLPIDPDFLSSMLGHALGRANLRHSDRVPVTRSGDASIIGNSPAILELLRKIRRVAKVDATVLVTGESGSGKELAAQTIHQRSARAGNPFVAVNCGAIPAALIQSELFGHTKGAFTGADKDGRGLIEAANEGTIFLDEIGDLSIELQTNLLRFLQERTITRVGSTRSIAVNVRVIAATHVDLEKAVAAGKFREDLYYRLNVVPLRVPALRECVADIETLAKHFFVRFGDERGAQLKGFSLRAVLAMNRHPWPGNVRELINRVRRAVVMAEGRLVAPQDLGLGESTVSRNWDALGTARKTAEKDVIASYLQQSGENVTETAKQLGVSRMTLYRLMAKHGIGQQQLT